MVSIGTEVFANVWSPEAMVSDIFLGKLEEHSSTAPPAITCGDYLGRSPYFVTIDMANVVKIWDILKQKSV